VVIIVSGDEFQTVGAKQRNRGQAVT